jgi:hypothetical protein
MKLEKSTIGLIGFSIAVALAVGPVAAQKPASASAEQVKAIET